MYGSNSTYRRPAAAEEEGAEYGYDGSRFSNRDLYRARDAELSREKESEYGSVSASAGSSERVLSAASTLPSYRDSTPSSSQGTSRGGGSTRQSSAVTPTTTYKRQHNEEMKALRVRLGMVEEQLSPQQQQQMHHYNHPSDGYSLGGESASLYSAYDGVGDRLDVLLENEAMGRSQGGRAAQQQPSNHHIGAAGGSTGSGFIAAMRAHDLRKPAIPGTLQTFETYGTTVGGNAPVHQHHGQHLGHGSGSASGLMHVHNTMGQSRSSLVSSFSPPDSQHASLSHTSILDTPKNVIILENRLNPHLAKLRNKSAELRDLSPMFHQGWSLAKGYDKRPRLHEIDDDVIEKDIEEFAQRSQKYLGKGPKHKFGSTMRCEPSMWGQGIILSRNAINTSRKQDVLGADVDVVPGPKYDTAESPGKTKKTAPFTTALRFGKEIPLSSQGPDAREGDLKAFSSMRSKGTVRIDSSGRMLYNSIFYEHFITPTKGLPIDTSKAITSLSKYTSFEGTKLPPKGRGNASDEMKSRRVQEKLDPLNKLKAIRRQIEECDM